jgi:tetratricopeptide (TPR) repeat protein
MSKSKYLIVLAIMATFSFFGYQCSSTEMTSAKLYIQQKNYDKAIESINKEIQKNPNSDEGYFYLGTIYHEKQNYKEMNSAFNKSLAISNRFASDIKKYKSDAYAIVVNRGAKAYGDAVKASKENKSQDTINTFLVKAGNSFNDALDIQPDSVVLYKNLLLVHSIIGDVEKMEDQARAYYKKEKTAMSYQFFGSVLYAKAKKELDKFKETKNPYDSVAAMTSYNEIIPVLKEGFFKYPDNAEILSSLSSSYSDANRLSEAISVFEESVKQNPKNEKYRFNYGTLLLNSNKYEEAIQQFEEALKINESYPNAIYNTAVAYVKWGTQINKENAEKNDSKVDNNLYKQKYEKALPYLEKYVTIDSKNAAIFELMGKVYSVLGKKDEAKNAFEKADALRK